LIIIEIRSEEMSMIQKDFSIVLCGEAGQGIQTVEYFLTHLLKISGYHVFATREFMSRIRGGLNSTEIRIGSSPVSAFVDRIDLLIPLKKGAIAHVKRRLSSDTIILGEKENLDEDFEIENYNFIEIAFSQLAKEIGGAVYANIIASGVLCSLFKASQELLTEFLTNYFSRKGEDVIQKNLAAITTGYEIGTQLSQSGRIEIDLMPDPSVKEDLFLSGVEAVGLGAIAGGCNFISSYPMSPSTDVLVFLAQNSRDFDIIVEQAEDELSSINMAQGAWYAGARGMVTTSGGGFALMVEGLSLAGMIESPIVIHLGQRPGPSTGLPTRTEQADLFFALFAGHGEFPRIILSPGTFQDGFYLTQKAFYFADKYQVPVFILTDQYFLDSSYNFPYFDLTDIKVEKQFIKTLEDYKRYQFVESGISPRGIPGYGAGLVGLDSDEHDEEGHITEDHDIRIKMVNKRLQKLESIKQDSIPPELIGPKKYKNIVVCWGSTYHPVKEALEKLGRTDTAALHFKQVYPLHPNTANYLKNAKTIVAIENNATAQFSNLIKLQTSIEIEEHILKYNGLPFSVEEIINNLQQILK